MATAIADPIMGELARAACRLPVEGAKRRRVLILLAAVADANSGSCVLTRATRAMLIERVPGIGDRRKLGALLGRLERDGLIRRPGGGVVELVCLEDPQRAGKA